MPVTAFRARRSITPRPKITKFIFAGTRVRESVRTDSLVFVRFQCLRASKNDNAVKNILDAYRALVIASAAKNLCARGDVAHACAQKNQTA